MPPFDPSVHHRRSIRLKDYDYSQAGAYFVTINTYELQHIFGEVGPDGVTLNELGMIVAECWEEIPAHYSAVELDAFVVMPNHVHGIIVINDVGAIAQWATHASPVQTEGVRGPKPSSIGAIVGQFKSATSRKINATRHTNIPPVWHRNFYERVIRGDREHSSNWDYIVGNPGRWIEQRPG